jgi:hypothetical protein
MSPSPPQAVKQSLDEVKALRQRLGTPEWCEADWGLLAGILASYDSVLSALLETQITLKRLMTQVFGTRPRRKAVGAGVSGRREPEARGTQGGAASGDAVPGTSGHEETPEEATPPVSGGHRPGYGRLGAEAYPGAARVACRHED